MSPDKPLVDPENLHIHISFGRARPAVCSMQYVGGVGRQAFMQVHISHFKVEHRCHDV